MGMVLNTNIGAIQAQRALTESRKDMEKAMERLSTGKRINGAADDAAGLAMVERMNTQIRGLTMATRNANDGISLIRTVENALVEVSGMLQRMRVLAVQSANDTNTATERAFANNELNQLQLEISRVSLNTRYNGAQVLNGSFSGKSLQVGTESGESISFSIANVESSKLGAFVISGTRRDAVSSTGTGTAPANGTNTNSLTLEANGISRTIVHEAGIEAKTDRPDESMLWPARHRYPPRQEHSRNFTRPVAGRTAEFLSMAPRPPLFHYRQAMSVMPFKKLTRSQPPPGFKQAQPVTTKFYSLIKMATTSKSLM